jgi:hypothetical protein
MKTCFLITTYCNTDIKVNSLRDTIDRIKKYRHDIVLYNHHSISTDVQNQVNFSIYDKSNPVLLDMDTRSMIYWVKIPKTPYKITRIMPDYGYAVAQQWKRGIQFVRKMGYERVYVINYDTKFSEDFFRKVETHLEDNVSFSIQYGDDSMYLAFFGVNLTDDFVKRVGIIDRTHYLENIGENIAEGYMYSLLSDYISKLYNFSEFYNDDITTDIVIANIDSVYIDSKYSVSAGLEKFVFGDETPNYDKLVVLFYRICTDLDFIVEYNGYNILKMDIKKENEYIYIHIPLKRDNIDYTKLKFIVNGDVIGKLNEYAQYVTIETLYQTI